MLLEQSNKPVIIGLSGGSDSVALLDILQKLGYNCIAAHCNFHLRDEESIRDENFVKQLTNSYDIKLYKIDFQTTEYAKKHSISIEMAARNLRYEWFEKIRKEVDGQAVATGHHLDDNIETVLINLTRGTGLKGLTGIPAKNGNVVRPLLNTSRKKIKEYLSYNNLSFVEDSTNISTDIVRNKFRHEIIPHLEKINPSLKLTFADTIQNLKGAYNIYNNDIENIKSKICKFKDELLYINIESLLQEKEQSTILYEILKDYNFNSSTIRQITENLNFESGKLFYSSTHSLLKDRTHLIVRPIFSTQNNLEKVKIRSRLLVKDDSFILSKDNRTVHLDADKINYPLTVRNWESADSFYPLGMKGKKKLSDFFIDLKINRFEKEKILVLLSQDEIIWVVGYRIDERFKVDENTKNIIELQIEY